MVFFSDDGENLLLTRVEIQAPVVKLTGDYRLIWLLLNNSESVPNQLGHKRTKDLEDFVSYLSEHNLLPDNHTIQSALTSLNDINGDEEMLGGMSLEAEELEYIEIQASLESPEDPYTYTSKNEKGDEQVK